MFAHEIRETEIRFVVLFPQGLWILKCIQRQCEIECKEMPSYKRTWSPLSENLWCHLELHWDRSDHVKYRCFPLRFVSGLLNFQIGYEVAHLLCQPAQHGELGKEWMHREPIWKGRLRTRSFPLQAYWLIFFRLLIMSCVSANFCPGLFAKKMPTVC